MTEEWTFRGGEWVRLGRTPTLVAPLSSASWLWDPIPASPTLDAHSATWAGYIAAGSSGKILNVYAYGIPTYEIPAGGTAPSYGVTATTYGVGSYAMRIPDAAAPAPDSDGAMVVIDRPLGRVYEMWQAAKSGGAWSASSCAIYPIGSTGTDDAIQGGGVTGWGCSRAAGTILQDELAAAWPDGDLGHALVFSGRIAADTWRYPATKSDGTNPDAVGTPCPEGARFQLDPTYDVNGSSMTTLEKVLARTLQTYGAYLIDNGGADVAISVQGNDDALATPPTDPGDATATGGWANTDYGIGWDYFGVNLPWSSMRVLANWDGA